MELSSIKATITLDDSGLDRGLDRAQQKIQQFGRQMNQGLDQAITSSEQRLQRFADGMTRFGQRMSLAVTAPLLLIGRQAVAIAADFEQSGNIFQAVSGATSTQMAQFSAVAKQLGADLTLPNTSAVDAAKAMTQLSRSGISVTDSMTAAKGALQLAAVANIDGAKAATVTAQALNAFQLAGSQATRVADLFAATTTKFASRSGDAAGAVHDLSVAFQSGATVAHSAGISIDDFTSSLALLAQRGIVGERAGTSFRVMIQRLQAPTKDAAAVLKALNIHIYDAHQRLRPFRDLVAEFTAKLGGATQQQRNWANAHLFGARAVGAANIVLEGGVKQFDKIEHAITKSGTAADLAAARNRGLKGALDALKSALETAAQAAIEPFLKDLTGLTLKVAEATNWFGRLPEPVRKAAVGFLAVAVAIGPLGLAVGGLIKGWQTMLPILTGTPSKLQEIGQAFLAAPGWFKLVVLAIGAFTIAWESNFLGMRTTVTDFATWISPTLKDMWAVVQSDAQDFFDKFQMAWDIWAQGLKASLTSQFGDIGATIGKVIQAPFKALQDWVLSLTEQQNATIDKIAGIFPGAKGAMDALRGLATIGPYTDARAIANAMGTAGPKDTPKQPVGAAGAAQNYGAANTALQDLMDKQGRGRVRKSPHDQELEQIQERLIKNSRIQTMLARGESIEVARLAGEYTHLSMGELRAAVASERVTEKAIQAAESQKRFTVDSGKLNAEIRRLKGGMDAEATGVEKLAEVYPGLSRAQLQVMANGIQWKRHLEEQRQQAHQVADAVRGMRQQYLEAATGNRVAAEAVKLFGAELLKLHPEIRTAEALMKLLTPQQSGQATKAATTGQDTDAASRIKELRRQIAINSYVARTNQISQQLFDKPAGKLTDMAHLKQVQTIDRLENVKEQSGAASQAWLGEQSRVNEVIGTANFNLGKLQESWKITTKGSLDAKDALELLGLDLSVLPKETQEVIRRFLDLRRSESLFRDFAQGVQGVFEGMFTHLYEHGFKGFFSSVIRSFEQMLQQMAAKYLASQLANLVMRLVGGVVGNLFGGEGTTIRRRAAGGEVQSGRPYLVGERGPELFVPRSSGSIMPNAAMAGAGNITVQMHISTPSVEGFRRNQPALMADALRSASRIQRRNGS